MIRAALLFGVIVLVASAADTAAQQRPARFAGHAAVGKAIALRWCTGCHTLPGHAAASDVAPSFRAIARDPHEDPDHLRGFLSRPHWPMPPLELSRNEIEDIIAYLHTIRHGRD
jgi:mono/diheme cytochrome c family protein